MPSPDVLERCNVKLPNSDTLPLSLRDIRCPPHPNQKTMVSQHGRARIHYNCVTAIHIDCSQFPARGMGRHKSYSITTLGKLAHRKAR